MKTRIFNLFLCLILISFSNRTSAQDIITMMDEYAQRLPIERMHIHFDKSIYNKEETIWYKAYINAGGGVTNLSTNLYVEWYDTTGKMIRQTVAPLFQSTAKGSFEIPVDYTGNFIRVKAYTRWMLNDDSAFHYQRDLIINTATSVVKSKPIVYKTKVDVFPEGGFLVNNLNSKIAFKAVNQFGLPVVIKGALLNNKNKVLDTLIVQHDGMGVFNIKPLAGETYYVRWKDSYGKSGITKLETPKAEGASIAISRTNEDALIKVERTASAPDEFKKMNLLVHMNGVLLFKVDLNATTQTVLNTQIPIYELQTGILQFSLFTSDWIPVAERIMYINNRMHEFSAKLVPQLTTLTKRGKNVIDVLVTDTSITNMSIAITDATLESTIGNTIYSDLLLSADIKGKIYNPGYYLSSDSDSVTANLDLVMMTNGWRRLDWEKLRKNILPEIQYAPENEMMKITGKVYGLKSMSLPADVMLNLVVVNKDSSRNMYFVPVNKDGSFENKGVFFYDTSRVFYSFNQNPTLTSIAQVQFENGLLRNSAKSIAYQDDNKPFIWSDSIANQKMSYFLAQQEDWKRRNSYKTLQEVIIKSKVKSKEQVLEEKYATGLFSGGDAYTFSLLDDPSAATSLDILTYLQGKVPGLSIITNGAQTSMNWRGAVPDLFLNEIPSNIESIRTVSVRDVAFIKVFRPPFFGAMGGGSGGAIVIYIRKGGDFNNTPNPGKGMPNTILTGYNRFKEFYNPQYDNPNEFVDTDVRTTLYWNPYIITNKKNPRYRIQFFNNDFSSKYKVVLEGMNAEGKLTRVVSIFE